MRSRANKRGKDEAVTIPVDARDGRIAMGTARETYDLNQLVQQISPENVHAEVDFGAPVGKETP